MALNAYINDFKDKSVIKQKCFVCKQKLSDNYFSLPLEEYNHTHDKIRAHIKQNRMCSVKCMNKITVKMNGIER